MPSAATTSTSRRQPAASTSRQPARRARSPTPDTSDDDDADDADQSKKGVKVRTERLKGNKGKLNVFDVVAGGTRRMLDQLMCVRRPTTTSRFCTEARLTFPVLFLVTHSEEHGKNPRTLKLLQCFASSVQSPLLSRVRPAHFLTLQPSLTLHVAQSALLSTLTAHTRALTSARTKNKKLRLELVEMQRARAEVEREMRRREEQWAREEKEAEVRSARDCGWSLAAQMRCASGLELTPQEGVQTITSTHDFLANLSAASSAWR